MCRKSLLKFYAINNLTSLPEYIYPHLLNINTILLLLLFCMLKEINRIKLDLFPSLSLTLYILSLSDNKAAAKIAQLSMHFTTLIYCGGFLLILSMFNKLILQTEFSLLVLL